VAIRIVQDLSATPDATRLPGTVTLAQTLKSTVAPEPVTILYLLDGSHDVWFRRDDQGLAKSLRFEATIDPAGTPLQHAVTLANGPGQGPMALVQIDETIETHSGIPLMSAVIVRILP
jgi:hypothetical protein